MKIGNLHMKYILFFDSLNLLQIIIWCEISKKNELYCTFFKKKMKLNILISHSTSTKTLRLQIHLKLFKEAFWS